MKDIISKYGKYIIIGALILVVMFFLLKSCQLNDRLTKLRTEYKLSQDIADTSEEIKDKIIEKGKKELEGLQVELKKIKKESEQKQLLLDNKIDKLTEQNKRLVESKSKPKTSKDKLINCEKRIKLWERKEEFFLAKLTEKDKLIFSLTENYEEQLSEKDKIIDGLKELNKKLSKQSVKSKKYIRVLERKYKSTRFKSGIKTTVILAVAGIVIYGLIQD